MKAFATTIAFLLVAAPAGARLPDAYRRSRDKLSIVNREVRAATAQHRRDRAHQRHPR